VDKEHAVSIARDHILKRNNVDGAKKRPKKKKGA